MFHNLSHFEPVSLSFIKDVVAHLKHTSSSNNVLPPKLFVKLIDTIGPSAPSIKNCSLTSGCVPSSLTHVVVQPFLKKSLA